MTKHGFVFVTNSEVSGRETRRADNKHIYNHQSRFVNGNALICEAVRKFNELPAELKQIEQLNVFKRELRYHLFDEQEEFF